MKIEQAAERLKEILKTYGMSERMAEQHRKKLVIDYPNVFLKENWIVWKAKKIVDSELVEV